MLFVFAGFKSLSIFVSAFDIWIVFAFFYFFLTGRAAA